MFVVVYRYKVPKKKTKEYIQIERQIMGIYVGHGCLGVEIFRDAKDARYWMEMNRFRDKEHYEEFVATVGKDARIESITKDFMSLFDEGEYKPEKHVYFKML